MFESIRKHSKIVMIVLFLLIIPSFVLFGVDGYRQSMSSSATVATVDGHDITQGDWDAAHRQNIERMRAQSPNVDTRLLDSPEARYASLERLVRERVLRTAAEQKRILPSDARLARILHDDPGVAALRGPDGKLDMAQYREALQRQGMTPEMYESSVRAELALRQIIDSVQATAFASTGQANAALDPFFEKRTIQVAQFKPQDFTAKVALTDADLQAYHQQHQQQFRVQEQADVEYLVLDLDSIKKTIVPTEQELRTYYERNQAKLAGQEERRASHILLTVAKDAPAAERDKAKAKADELLAAARKNPAQFAELARKNSQDPGSAANGGDLDFFARGAMVKPFEDAAFALKKGEISDVVASDFGYHIIMLTDIKAPKVRTFAELRPELEAEYRQQRAQAKFSEAAETFTNAVYEQAESLQPAAERLKLTVRTATQVTRAPAPGAAGALASPRLLEALFSADAIEKKRNTEAIEIGPNQLAAARIVRHTPAQTPAFEAVQARVRELATAQRAAELARKDGEARLAAWKADPAKANLPAAVTVSRGDPQQQPRAVVDAAMRVAAAPLPGFEGVDLGVDLGGEGYAVVRVNKVEARQPATGDNQARERAQVVQWWSSAEGAAYYELLKEKMKVRIKADRPAASTVEG
ncbi:SurA N-terminal domain-containing protein [Xylophilus ampelinus]|uniref:Periplasmic chaperone PpiD n=1 Tax=Xylophilus ampelinus TaxID=54067 RepID=A0A318SLD8_9BURK|nr:SurA N-terminal domain-containing protein [Xylophilus ampelinus]MCS4510326.1 SurA N-terminal domain-containing protein [Xylophilus ampelinus]PYE78051.1 peptidyl-prolyl cis-trans isomerase D [Xylophilus ampelinus]